MIKRKDFEKGNFRKRFTDRSEHPVSKLLRKYKGYAIDVKEIAKLTKMNVSTCRCMLVHLVKDGLVVKKLPYFAWKK